MKQVQFNSMKTNTMKLTQEFIRNQWHLVDAASPKAGMCPVNFDQVKVIDSDSSLQNLRRRASKTHKYNATQGVWYPKFVTA